MWWAFGTGVAVGLIVGAIGAGIWLIPHLMMIVTKAVETASRAVRFPSPPQILDPFAPSTREDPFASVETDEEQVPDWMLDKEEA